MENDTVCSIIVEGKRAGHMALSSPQHDGERHGVVSASEENDGEGEADSMAR
jgi:hypothetical protein